MGEYAKRISDGERVKIGTCEDMYYLRADQRHLIEWQAGNVNVQGSEVFELRFRFPWPHEDGTLPGNFEDPFKAVGVHGFKAPEAVEHHTVQFSATPGYLLSLPCPEGSSTSGLAIHRNGFRGAVLLQQQKLLTDGRLVPICHCGGCGTAWRLEEPAEIEALAVSFRSEADRRVREALCGPHRETAEQEGRWWHEVADRILDGAKLAVAV